PIPKNGFLPAAQLIASWKACQLVRDVTKITKSYELANSSAVGGDSAPGASATGQPHRTVGNPEASIAIVQMLDFQLFEIITGRRSFAATNNSRLVLFPAVGSKVHTILLEVFDRFHREWVMSSRSSRKFLPKEMYARIAKKVVDQAHIGRRVYGSSE
ncbi:hypothetical protein MJO28_006910, partial [Puccinia striiformis f. sp. tritici]